MKSAKIKIKAEANPEAPVVLGEKKIQNRRGQVLSKSGIRLSAADLKTFERILDLGERIRKGGFVIHETKLAYGLWAALVDLANAVWHTYTDIYDGLVVRTPNNLDKQIKVVIERLAAEKNQAKKGSGVDSLVELRKDLRNEQIKRRNQKT